MPKAAISCSLEALTSLPIEVSGPGVSPRDSARHGAEPRIFQPLRLHIPVRDPVAHRGVADRRPSVELEPARQIDRSRRNPGRGASPTARRSFISVVSATCQPAPTAPRRWLSGMRTSVKNTSLKCACPEICLIGRMSMPGDFMSRKKKVRPLCFGRSGSLRATRMP